MHQKPFGHFLLLSVGGGGTSNILLFDTAPGSFLASNSVFIALAVAKSAAAFLLKAGAATPASKIAFIAAVFLTASATFFSYAAISFAGTSYALICANIACYIFSLNAASLYAADLAGIVA